MKANRCYEELVAALVFVFGLLPAGIGATPGPVWSYSLLEGSHLVDDCPPCGRPTIAQPMRGTFELRLVEENPISTRYEVERVAFTAGAIAGRTYTVTGRGTYIIGGEVALVQTMFLEVYIDDGNTNRLCYFTNTTSTVSRRWPMLHIELDQTNGLFAQVYQLTLAAAPLREIWFSTLNGFHSAKSQTNNAVSAGDLLSSSGRIVKRNSQLTASLPMPSVQDIGLDALDVLPGGEIVLSSAAGAAQLRHGDLLFSRSGTVLPNEMLLMPITGVSPGRDLGLDAVQVMPQGQFYFSVQSNHIIVNDPQPVIMIRRGDLLFSDLTLEEGRVAKRNSELLARFHPSMANPDLGLDAFYLWSSGEIWFSLEDGFQDQQFGPIQPGDLLSDDGYVVYRNLELLSPFAPIEDLADFGLDALFVVTDAAPAAPAARFTSIQRERTNAFVHLEWEGTGRVFQVQRALHVAAPYTPMSPLTPDLRFDDADTTANQSFYRLQQW